MPWTVQKGFVVLHNQTLHLFPRIYSGNEDSHWLLFPKIFICFALELFFRPTNFSGFLLGFFFVLNYSHKNTTESGGGGESLHHAHCRAFLCFFFPPQSKCFASNSMYLNWQKQGYFLSCCLPLTGARAVILQPICSRSSHFPALPGRCQQIPVCAWGLSTGWGKNLHPTARASLYSCWCSGRFILCFSPCFPPQNTIPGFKF